MLFSVIAYSFTGGKRDFTSQSQIVATSYAVLCAADQAHKARSLLQPIGGVVSGWPEPAVPVVPAQTAPPATPPGSAAAPPSGTGEPPA